ncbi:ABC transporter permease [Anaeromyxobacter oryzae]|uniref:ABC transporter n=1 Tax=Anaeromyxobacter oryzae TaxID=2918170 RepID=A0ABM7WYE4_9BACT|nr:ABC transporter permease [Anaeromyxobacter oryzae]BDG04540.1 ABC transporter [Anaeromyxobacter oryzae]
MRTPAPLDDAGMALGALRASPLRSLLTALGVVIGAATVVAMMSLTEGLRVEVTRQMALLEAGAFRVDKWPMIVMGHAEWHRYARRKDITREQGEALRALPHVAYVSVEESGRRPEALATRARRTRSEIEVIGAVPDYEFANAFTVARGRFLSHVDVALARRVAFIGAAVADLLFPGEDPVGQEVRIRGVPFEVIGVAERMGTVLGLESKDGFAVVPWTAYDAVIGRSRNTSIAVRATSIEDQAQAMVEVKAALRRSRGLAPQEEDDFEVFSNETAANLFDDLARLVGAATFGLCALSLLVGGIGIMNIMLVSVTERTREIGLRMALGARRRRILAQFLVESLVLSVAGGLLGVALGGAVAVAARGLDLLPARVPAWSIALAVGSAAAAGLLFGIYPAARASRLDPVEAMRTE